MVTSSESRPHQHRRQRRHWAKWSVGVILAVSLSAKAVTGAEDAIFGELRVWVEPIVLSVCANPEITASELGRRIKSGWRDEDWSEVKDMAVPGPTPDSAWHIRSLFKHARPGRPVRSVGVASRSRGHTVEIVTVTLAGVAPTDGWRPYLRAEFGARCEVLSVREAIYDDSQGTVEQRCYGPGWVVRECDGIANFGDPWPAADVSK